MSNKPYTITLFIEPLDGHKIAYGHKHDGGFSTFQAINGCGYFLYTLLRDMAKSHNRPLSPVDITGMVADLMASIDMAIAADSPPAEAAADES